MYMEDAINRARHTVYENAGGPFGAVIVKNGEVISIASNTVLRDNDPTAHAEMNAIKGAGKALNTYDLSGCEIYATGYPCPMCMSAIMWSNIRKIYYGTDLKDAGAIGFRDDKIYDFIKNGNESNLIEIENVDRDKCLKLFEEYKNMGKTIY
ncbi:MAG: nucleoside deaminase [Clostridia bacterium]|nr:nucleoside deaminase [Clostridia bacterium]